MSEHTGTHFDAPIHWITGRDLPDASVDTIPPRNFVAPACGSTSAGHAQRKSGLHADGRSSAAWEKQHGRIPGSPGSWVCCAPTGRNDRRATTPTCAGRRIRRGRAGSDEMAGRGARRARLRHGDDRHRPRPGLPFQPAASRPPLHPRRRQIPGCNACAISTSCRRRARVIFSAPLKIKQGSGSPLRVLALVAGLGA